MVKIRIIGIEEGQHRNSFVIQADKLFGEQSEFIDEIEIETITKFMGGTIKVSIEYFAEAKLICDRSGEEFIEDIEGSYELIFEFHAGVPEAVDVEDRERTEIEGNGLVIDELLRQELKLAIPLKKISPKFKDVDFDEIHPELSKEKDKENPTWNKLKNLNFN